MRRTALAALAVVLASCAAPPPTADDGPGGGPGGGPGPGGTGKDAGSAAGDGGTGDGGTSGCLPTLKFPAGRGELAGAADPALQQAVFFGGDTGTLLSCLPQPLFSGETWLFDVACKGWKLLSGGPSPRARLASAFDSKRRRLIVFGGRFRAGTTGLFTVYDETWAFDFTTLKWALLTPTGAIPTGRTNATLVYDSRGDRLLLYGGNVSSDASSFDPQSTVHSLSLDTLIWTDFLVNGVAIPPARLFHGAALDEKRNRMIIYGGGGAFAFQGPFFGDVWALDLSAGIWTEQKPAGPAPSNRVRASLVADPERDRLLLFGGHDDTAMGEKNDLWSLELLGGGKWVALKAGDTLKNGTPVGQCQLPPDFTTPALDAPERRDSHAMVSLGAGKGFLVFGGKSDCGNLQDVWTLDAAKAAWTKALPSTSGESCTRSGKLQCTTLCN